LPTNRSPLMDLGIQDRSIKVPVESNRFGNNVLCFKKIAYRIHIIVG
jgi:hypothetical protein